MVKNKINQIELDEIIIPKGNFAFVYECTKNEDLFRYCLYAEKYHLSDVGASLKYIRNAIEQFGYFTSSLTHFNSVDQKTQINNEIKNKQREYKEFCRDRKKTANMNDNELREMIDEKTPKGMAIKALKKKGEQLTDSQKQEIFNHLSNLPKLYIYNCQKNKCEDILKNIIINLYSISSSNSLHVGGRDKTEDLVLAIKILYLVLKIYFNQTQAFDENISPIQDYYIYPSRYVGSTEEKLPSESKHIYFKLRDGKPLFYLIKEIHKNSDNKAAKRDLSSILRLWNDGFNTPESVIIENELIKAFPYDYQVFRLPGRPFGFTPKNIFTLSTKQKESVVQDVLRALRSLHTATPPMTHRGLNPTSFLLCKTGYGFRAILVNFETSKSFKRSNYTVKETLDKYYSDQFLKEFIAPEIIDQVNCVDYIKSDIYSLGRLIFFVYTGMAWPSDERMKDIPESLLDVITQMVDTVPSKRPTIEVFFSDNHREPPKDMIEFAAAMDIGERREQQDGLFIDHECAKLDDHYNYSGRRTESPILIGLFDGFGGIYDGRLITEEAISTMQKIQNRNSFLNMNNGMDFIRTVVEELESSERELIKREKLSRSGCATVIARIQNNEIFTANLGDSAIYYLKNNDIKILHKAHRYDVAVLNEGEIYQYLGITAHNRTIEPHYNHVEFQEGAYLLLCTDGLTNYVSEDKIKNIIYGSTTLMDKVRNLMNEAFQNGGSDNITIILLNKRRK